MSRKTTLHLNQMKGNDQKFPLMKDLYFVSID